MSSYWTLCPLIAGLATAVVIDCRSRRIPNFLSVGLLIAGLLLNAMVPGSVGLLSALAGAAVGFAAFFPLWMLGGFGAGDVKLMAAVGALLGLDITVIAVPATLVAGAILAIGFVAWRATREGLAVGPTTALALTSPRTLLGWLKVRFPYALAIATGSAFAVWAAP